MARGYLSIVLHAHLPYVRPAPRCPSEREAWLYERARDCYLPLIRVLDRLHEDNVRTRLTLSLSPTLIAQLCAPLVQERLVRHLNDMIELSARELNRTALMPELRRLSGTYHLRLLQIHQALVQRCGGNMVTALAEMEARGQIELITGPASHAFLPGLAALEPQAVRCQIQLGMDEFAKAFGHPPAGFWLPECAYTPELDEVLEREGIGYVIVDGRALERATPPAFHGVLAPVYCPSGVAAFGRDRDGPGFGGCDALGRPTDPTYRNNRVDIADELPPEYLRPHMPGDGVRVSTGIRYERIGGGNGESRVYQRTAALDRAAEAALDYMTERMHRTEATAWKMDRPPIFVSAYEIESFGYRWFEGIEFLDYLVRKVHFDQNVLETVTPGEYLDRHRCNQMTTPAASSWSGEGYFEPWVTPGNAWVYSHLSRATRLMRELTAAVSAARLPDDAAATGDRGIGNDLPTRALRAAGRQLVLAQSSDWLTMMGSPEHGEYARDRLRLHLSNFARVASQIRDREIKSCDIEALEREWPIFEQIRTDAYD
jgi:1,4-alpha-glucan branching enzyme